MTDLNLFCIACNGEELEGILDLGDQKPVNNLSEGSANLPRIALGLSACKECGHGQLTYFVTPSLLFDDYLYASSTSQSLKEYQRAFATTIFSSQKEASDFSVLEIASNDGLLLESFRKLGVEATGIDPARRMAERANKLGLKTHIGFWPQDSHLVGDIKFSLIVGQNVLAHTPDPLGFMVQTLEHLKPSGIAIFQTSQADMVRNGEFDTIYHEHYSYFCENSARILSTRAGFQYFDARYSTIHGTSAIYFFSQDAEAIATVVSAFDTTTGEWSKWRDEESRKFRSRVTRSMNEWREFGSMAKSRMAEVKRMTLEARSRGRRIIAVGAAAKGITFLRAANIRVDLILDEAPEKIDLEIDGLDIRITNLSSFQAQENDFFVFTAWNFSRELATKLLALGAFSDAEACLYFPSLRRTTLKNLQS
jgi:SAM-dependent methyltransferase